MLAFQLLILFLGVSLGFALSVWGPSPAVALKSASWWGAGLGFSIAFGSGLAVAMYLGVLWLSKRELVWFREIEALLDQVLVPSLRRLRVWQLFLLAILAGVGEEALFRWGIQGWLEFAFLAWAPRLSESDEVSSELVHWFAFGSAALIAGVAFGLCHAVTRAYFVMATIMGLVFSLVAVAGGGLVGAMIGHGLYDFMAFLWLCGSESKITSPGAENEIRSG